jgi:hypothetical protein
MLGGYYLWLPAWLPAAPQHGQRNRRFGLSETISSVSISQLNGAWAYIRTILSTRNPEFLGFS